MSWVVRWSSGEPDPLGAQLDEGPGPVQIGHLCPRCGSADHGRPWATVGGRPVQVSVARSGPHAVSVVADVPVGIDVENAAAVLARWQPELVLAPGEDNGQPARSWVAKEAVLKLLGTGLDRPMTSIRLADFSLVDLSAPDGYVAVLARARPAEPSP